MRRHHRERGATLVEFALIVPLLMLLVFAVVDLGITYNNQQGMRNGVREAGRRAIVGPAKVGTSTCGSTISGSTSPSHVSLICLAKQRAGLVDAAMSVAICFPKADGTCPETSDPDGPSSIGDTIRICAITPVRSTSGLLTPFLQGYRLTTKVDLRLEQPWTGDAGTSQETPARGSWTFCNSA